MADHDDVQKCPAKINRFALKYAVLRHDIMLTGNVGTSSSETTADKTKKKRAAFPGKEKTENKWSSQINHLLNSTNDVHQHVSV